MDSQKFNQLIEEQLNYCKELLSSKNDEYAQKTDKLSNFRQSSSLLGMCAAEVAFCYDTKHIASIQKIVHEISQGKFPTKELWREKITDYINYGLLINACVMEVLDKKEEQ